MHYLVLIIGDCLPLLNASVASSSFFATVVFTLSLVLVLFFCSKVHIYSPKIIFNLHFVLCSYLILAYNIVFAMSLPNYQ